MMHSPKIKSEDKPEDNKLMNFIKRTYIIFIVIFLILLFVANSAPAYHVISVFSGRLVSTKIDENFTFNLGNEYNIIFSENIFERIKAIYLNNLDAEFKLCLLGNIKGQVYNVTDFYIPRLFERSVYSVRSELCSADTIISMHSHPPLRCIFSSQDLQSYKVFQSINPDGMIALICGEERMSFYKE